MEVANDVILLNLVKRNSRNFGFTRVRFEMEGNQLFLRTHYFKQSKYMYKYYNSHPKIEAKAAACRVACKTPVK